MNRRFFKSLTLSILFLSSFILAGKEVDILSFNDFHGAMKEDGKNPGMAKFVYAVKQEVNKNPKGTIVVSAGDSYQGSALSVLTEGAPVKDMLTELKVPVSAVGNHEFDWGIDSITKLEKDSSYKFVIANLLDAKTGKPLSWTRPYMIVKKDGIKIAFIGLTTKESAYKTTIVNEMSKYKFADPAKTLQKWIDYLKAGKDKSGVPDVIIALTHIESYQDKKTGEITGDDVIKICKTVNGVDAVITGHSHEEVCGFINKIPVIQAKSYGRELGQLKIDLSDSNKIEKVTPIIIKLYDKVKSLKADAQAQKIYGKYSKKIEKFDKVIATVDKELSHKKDSKGLTTLGDLVSKIIAKETGSEIGLLNGGGLRCSLGPGNITVSKMYDLVPFDNYVYTMNLKGSDIKKNIEHGLFNPDSGTGDTQFYGVRIYVNKEEPYMDRIVEITLRNGEPLDMDKYYKVATIDFIYNGGDNYDFKGGKNVVDTNISLRDMIDKYLMNEKEITVEPVDALTLVHN